MAGSSEKKRLIESSAVTLFSEVGYGETSVRDIVSHSGTSLATFYRHYAGKQELLRALVEPRLAEVLKRVMAELETEPDPVERLLLAVRCGFDFVAEDQLFASLLSYQGARDEIGQEVEQLAGMFDKLGAMLLEHAWGDQPWFEDAVGAVTMIRMVIAGWFAWERHREGGTSRLRVANTMETILRAAIHDFIRTSAAVDTRNVA